VQIRADEAEKLAPFRISGTRPAAQVVIAAYSLLGDEQLVAALPEGLDAKDGSETSYNVFAVTETRLIVVRGQGAYGWVWDSRDQEMKSLTARTWRLDQVSSIESADLTLQRNQGMIYAEHRLVVNVDGEEPITLPEFAIGDDESESPSEPFQQALISAWSGGRVDAA